MNRRLLACAFCTVAGAALTLFCQGQQPGKRYALLVGVNEYDHPRLTQLRYSENDVVEMAKLLKSGGYEVTLLRGRDATKARIDARLGEILRTAQRADSVLVAFAGHGLQFAEQKDGYFCPVEAKPFNDEIATLVSLGKIYNDLDRSYANVKVLLVDACRNDGSRGTRGVDGDNAPRPPRGVAAFFSCTAGEVAYEHEKFKHGVFFHYVLEGLRGEAKNKRGEVTFGTLQDYVCINVAETVAELIGGGAKQSPNVVANLQGASPVLFANNVPRTAEPTNPATISKVVKPLPVIRDDGKHIANSIGMNLVFIPPGTFTMGSPDTDDDRDNDEAPAHRVEISQPFYMSVFEVTQEQYQRLMEKNPSAFAATGGSKNRVTGIETSNFPVESVTWHDAFTFCRMLSERSQEKAAGRIYDLPTEAEWEYACRAQTTTLFNCGTQLSSLEANFNGNFPYGKAARGPNLERPAQVGSYEANAFGLFDMHGNVSEWCADWYSAKYYGTSPPRDPKGGDGYRRVQRGGSWVDSGVWCRAAERMKSEPDSRAYSVGFRVVYRPSDRVLPVASSPQRAEPASVVGPLQNKFRPVDLIGNTGNILNKVLPYK